MRPFSRSEEIFLFLLLSCLLSWGAWLGLRELGMPLAPRMLVAMFGPMLAARALTRRDQPVTLVTLEGGRGWLKGLLGVLLGAGLAVVLVSLGAFLSIFSGDIGIRAGFHASLAHFASQAPILLGFYAISIVAAYGEEYGWRGYLHARLLRFGPLGAALITGPVWALWHSPAIMVDGFDYSHDRIIGVGMLVLLFLPLSIIQAWLRETTGGLAAPTAAHAVFNIGAGLLALFTTHASSVLAAPVGLLGFVPFAVFAVALLATGQVKVSRPHHALAGGSARPTLTAKAALYR